MDEMSKRLEAGQDVLRQATIFWLPKLAHGKEPLREAHPGT